MFARLIVPAVVGALVLSTSAFAASNSPTSVDRHDRMQTAAVKSAERCTALENQFDEVIKTHGGAAKAGDARMMRTEGGSLCAQGHHEEGAIKIEQALKNIGVSPKT